MPLPVTITPEWQRRLIAGALAFGINAALLSFILFGRVEAPPPPLEALQVTLVQLPEPPPPEPEPEPVSEPEPDPEPVIETPPPDPVREPVEDTTPPTSAPVSAQAVDTAPEEPASGERDIYSVSPGARSVLAGLQCPGDPEGFARTGVCPDSARRGMSLAARPESASDHYAIDVTALRAEWGIGPGILAGEPTLDNPQERRTLSNSDQVRDTLPPSIRDPAFGD
ncbi:hypothetical protein [Hyphobacterium marinum]|uniref:Energy transducer TonB n=1 Tax=Hyphobacterium marinum TaxID=3116574 RepID=A0ABU7LX38_9PROT|nr:hypothetical protein [Hyphobacterium sp. Y6023]MEE2566129.1 hypothetical protein [Hyphobacterium sp. Y6023]